MAGFDVDIVVVGGGIVGLSTAYQLSELANDLRILVVEKEEAICLHQSGRNSGVIHSGIYYQPGSLKAKTCLEGKAMLESFCREHGIAFESCGKVIVAVEDAELPAMDKIYARGQANGVACRIIDRHELQQLEPHAAGVAAIHVPGTGIVDYPGVCNVLADRLRKRGHTILLQSPLRSFASHEGYLQVVAGDCTIKTRQLVNCAGLHCDRVMRLCGATPPAKIIPFRGEYYELTSDAEYLCRNLIYPVPNPNFPFLGVHFTRMVHGGVECGPNAVLAMAREGYDWSTWNLRDLSESLTYPGFMRIASRFWKTGAGEIVRSLSKSAFVKALQRLIPAIQIQQLHRAPAGVRAQAIAPDGSMVDDFLIVDQPRAIHVCNAPSPAATASLKIGQHIAHRVLEQQSTLE